MQVIGVFVSESMWVCVCLKVSFDQIRSYNYNCNFGFWSIYYIAIFPVYYATGQLVPFKTGSAPHFEEIVIESLNFDHFDLNKTFLEEVVNKNLEEVVTDDGGHLKPTYRGRGT